jgi:hypothetical protein
VTKSTEREGLLNSHFFTFKIRYFFSTKQLPPLTPNPSTWFKKLSIICWSRGVRRDQVRLHLRLHILLYQYVYSQVILPYFIEQAMTVMIVAHRLSTVRNADIIFVVQDGQVVEQGNHTDLIEKPDGAYASLIKRQMLVQKKLEDSQD